MTDVELLDLADGLLARRAAVKIALVHMQPYIMDGDLPTFLRRLLAVAELLAVLAFGWYRTADNPLRNPPRSQT